MGLFDMFRGKDEEDDFDPLSDLSLKKLKPGYYVDYDMKSWQVTAYNRYKYDGSETGHEWELTAGREKCYLGCSTDDEDEWTLCKKLPIGAIDKAVTDQVIQQEDPPNQITVKGKTYYLDESGPGYFHKDGGGRAVEFIYWTFIDDDDEQFISIEQWDEEDFEAVEGHYVEEYQFSNILPGQ